MIVLSGLSGPTGQNAPCPVEEELSKESVIVSYPNWTNLFVMEIVKK